MSITYDEILGEEWAFVHPWQPEDGLEEEHEEDDRRGFGLLAIGTVSMIAVLLLATVACVGVTA